MDSLPYLAIVMPALLAMRLVWLRLNETLPRFTLFLLFYTLLSFAPLTSKPGTTAYAYAWLTSAPILMLFQFGVVHEMFRRSCEHYPGIGRFAAWLLLAAAVIGAIAAACTIPSELRAWEGRGVLIINAVTITQRYVATSLAVLIVGVQLFFARYPTDHRRNVVWHGRILTLYLVIVAASYWIHNLTAGEWRPAANLILLLGELLCMVAWGALLTPSGELLPERNVHDAAKERAAAAEARVNDWMRTAEQTLRAIEADRRRMG